MAKKQTGDDYEQQQITTWRLRELLAKEKAYDALVAAERQSPEQAIEQLKTFTAAVRKHLT